MVLEVPIEKYILGEMASASQVLPAKIFSIGSIAQALLCWVEGTGPSSGSLGKGIKRDEKKIDGSVYSTLNHCDEVYVVETYKTKYPRLGINTRVRVLTKIK